MSTVAHVVRVLWFWLLISIKKESITEYCYFNLEIHMMQLNYRVLFSINSVVEICTLMSALFINCSTVLDIWDVPFLELLVLNVKVIRWVRRKFASSLTVLSVCLSVSCRRPDLQWSGTKSLRCPMAP